jgi:hypothetical protein
MMMSEGKPAGPRMDGVPEMTRHPTKPPSLTAQIGDQTHRLSTKEGQHDPGESFTDEGEHILANPWLPRHHPWWWKTPATGADTGRLFRITTSPKPTLPPAFDCTAAHGQWLVASGTGGAF